MGWASEEFQTIDLGDKRMIKRVTLLAERLVDSPSASIPKTCQRWKETQSVALCIQDTSSLDFIGQDIEGLGPLQYEGMRGMFLHPTYVATPNREQLGTINSWRWAREFRDENGIRPEDISESGRWIEGLKGLHR